MNLMPRLAGKDDVVLVNLGIHYNNMWDLQEDVTMMSTTLTQPGMPKNVFWVESGPQHYETETGAEYYYAGSRYALALHLPQGSLSEPRHRAST